MEYDDQINYLINIINDVFLKSLKNNLMEKNDYTRLYNKFSKLLNASKTEFEVAEDEFRNNLGLQKLSKENRKSYSYLEKLQSFYDIDLLPYCSLINMINLTSGTDLRESKNVDNKFNQYRTLAVDIKRLSYTKYNKIIYGQLFKLILNDIANGRRELIDNLSNLEVLELTKYLLTILKDPVYTDIVQKITNDIIDKDELYEMFEKIVELTFVKEIIKKEDSKPIDKENKKVSKKNNIKAITGSAISVLASLAIMTGISYGALKVADIKKSYSTEITSVYEDGSTKVVHDNIKGLNNVKPNEKGFVNIVEISVYDDWEVKDGHLVRNATVYRLPYVEEKDLSDYTDILNYETVETHLEAFDGNDLENNENVIVKLYSQDQNNEVITENKIGSYALIIFTSYIITEALNILLAKIFESKTNGEYTKCTLLKDFEYLISAIQDGGKSLQGYCGLGEVIESMKENKKISISDLHEFEEEVQEVDKDIRKEIKKDETVKSKYKEFISNPKNQLLVHNYRQNRKLLSYLIKEVLYQEEEQNLGLEK